MVEEGREEAWWLTARWDDSGTRAATRAGGELAKQEQTQHRRNETQRRCVSTNTGRENGSDGGIGRRTKEGTHECADGRRRRTQSLKSWSNFSRS